MTGKDGWYRVSAVPVVRPKGTPMLRLTAVFPQGSVRGLIEDGAFKVGRTAVQFSDVRRVLLGSRPRVWSRDGKILRGDLTGLKEVPVRLGTARVTLDLAKATEIRLEPPAGLASLTATVVARRQGKEVGSLSRFLGVQGVPQPGEEEIFLDLEEPKLEKNVVVRELDAPIADVAVGGGGRYLILHLPKVEKLAVFDVNQAKVVKLLPARDANLKFTAGLDKLVVALPGSGTIERWDLTTLERDLTVDYPVKGQIVALAMGSASKGPIMVLAREGNQAWAPVSFFLLTATKLQRREIGWTKTSQQHFAYSQAVHLRSSPDGKAMGVWCTGQIPSGVTWIRRDGQIVQSTYSHTSNGHVIPGPAGKLLFTGAGVLTNVAMFPNQNKTYPGTGPGGRYLPAVHSDYYLYLGAAPTPTNRNPARACDIYKLGVNQPILQLSDVEIPTTDEQQIKTDFTLDKRVHLLPQAKVLIVIPASNDRLVLYRVDVEGALKKMTRAPK
jgi:hypothetical protein